MTRAARTPSSSNDRDVLPCLSRLLHTPTIRLPCRLLILALTRLTSLARICFSRRADKDAHVQFLPPADKTAKDDRRVQDGSAPFHSEMMEVDEGSGGVEKAEGGEARGCMCMKMARSCSLAGTFSALSKFMDLIQVICTNFASLTRACQGEKSYLRGDRHLAANPAVQNDKRDLSHYSLQQR